MGGKLRGMSKRARDTGVSDADAASTDRIAVGVVAPPWYFPLIKAVCLIT